ncbi:MAG: hydrogenase iron-sulfur subunit [Clostridiales bacterium]|jgi:Pyruvate/2-oxoacid:ferredoxin oxidoreductase delta subunit/coenzyme F420-reducing hydrogenase delta subunit|nr:hydrogenase iron-sulfur subunit [Clostridiales bacterium]
MKAVLAGKSNYSEGFKAALTEAGLELIMADTASDLKGLPEEMPVVLLYDAKISPLVTDRAVLDRSILGLKPHDMIVFLMDKDEEASPYVESRVIDAASYLASIKRRVTVLMRSSRASDERFDDRYMSARNKGVTFIKYDDIEISENDEIYLIEVYDGKISVSLETPLLIDCGEKPTPELEDFVKALRLRTYGDGCITGNRWFLNQGSTFKRNVKLINTIALDGDLNKVIPALVKDIHALSKPGQGQTAFVDSKKCAYCYTCYRVCPHSALGPDENAAAMKVNDLLCAACGICVAVCPASAITFKGEKVEGDRAEKSGKKLKMFCCENSALIASKNALDGLDAAVEAVPCGGDITSEMMTKALKDYERVMVAVCCDDACKHRDGNKRVIRQVERLKERLEKLGHDSHRLSCIQTGVTMSNILKGAAEKALSGGGKK